MKIKRLGVALLTVVMAGAVELDISKYDTVFIGYPVCTTRADRCNGTDQRMYAQKKCRDGGLE